MRDPAAARAVSGSDPGGVCIPVVTPLDAEGRISEPDLRSLLRHLAPQASILFLCGTTGEWNRIASVDHRRALSVGIDEGKKMGDSRTQVWAGVTATARQDTLDHLSLALELRADAAVIAPLAIREIGDLVRFFQRDIPELFERFGRDLPVYLYDNADIAVDPLVPHLRTRDVKSLSRLPWIRGMKVSGPRSVLGNYTKAAANFREDFRIFAGNPMLAFELFRPRVGVWGTVQDYWTRYLLHHRLPVGIVAGTANLAPVHWRRAWAACQAGDLERMEALRQSLHSLHGAWVFESGGRQVKKTIAAMKKGLEMDGVIRDARIGDGTPSLTKDEAALFADRYNRWKEAYGRI